MHFMRQIYMPKMGPDGGDGGRGGHVFFEASTHLQSLLDFKFQPKYHADNGNPGMGQDCNGRNGEDLTVKVPLGTILYDADTGEMLCDLVEEGRKVLVLSGGRGGLGNMNFATAARQAPDWAQPGRPGMHRKLRLELKLLADVGLVGFPNAGKSTLIARWSAARPKIADYPFTTLVPNLGVVRGKGLDFVMADIPGLIEGASEGRGLGIRFLKHCERTRLLVILLDLDPSTGRNLLEELQILEQELAAFSDELGVKERIVVLNKADAFRSSESEDPLFAEFLRERGVDELHSYLKSKGEKMPLIISAVTGAGLDILKNQIEAKLLGYGPREFSNQLSTTLSLGNQEMFAT